MKNTRDAEWHIPGLCVTGESVRRHLLQAHVCDSGSALGYPELLLYAKMHTYSSKDPRNHQANFLPGRSDK